MDQPPKDKRRHQIQRELHASTQEAMRIKHPKYTSNICFTKEQEIKEQDI